VGQVKFLGFIDRAEQLLILKNSIAVIQPSLFEGWSTVVEDCKAQNHNIILSSLPVHKEQISEGAIFFNPYEPQDLANSIRNFKAIELKFDYDKSIIKFAQDFMKVLQ
jgi:hypothetical protein